MKKLESKLNQKTFFQVRSKIPDCIKKGEKTACTPEEQRELFAEYFEELATPNKGNNKITELRTILQRESQNS